MKEEYVLLRQHCPLLFNVVAGAMGVGEGKLEVVSSPF